MPTLMLRGLSSATVARLTAYARSRELGRAEAAQQLLTIALDHLDARSAGGAARHAGTTKAERSNAARKAVQARWAKHDAETR